MMDSEKINYSKLTEKELKILISANDGSALEEFNKRAKEGKIKFNHYTCHEANHIVSKKLKGELESEIDYTKLTDRELKILMGARDLKADEEYDNRIASGKIKTRRVTFEDIRKMYGIDKAS